MARKPVSAIVDGKRIIVKKPELLAPAGSLEKLKIAVMYGADAVFIVDASLVYAQMPKTFH